MFKAIKEFFLGKPTAPATDAKVEAVNAAPYKIEAPVAAPVVEAKPAKKPAAKKPAAPKAKAPAKKALAKAGEKKQPAKKAPAKKSK